MIVAGGYTNQRTAPDLSEAELLADYLKKCQVFQPIFLCSDSITTAQNLKVAKKVIETHQWQKHPIIIFCDAVRQPKVQILGRIILGKWPAVISYNLNSGLLQFVKQTIFALPLSVLVQFVPLFEKLELAWRQRIIEKS